MSPTIPVRSIGSAPRFRNNSTSSTRPQRQAQPSGVLFAGRHACRDARRHRAAARRTSPDRSPSNPPRDAATSCSSVAPFLLRTLGSHRSAPAETIEVGGPVALGAKIQPILEDPVQRASSRGQSMCANAIRTMSSEDAQWRPTAGPARRPIGRGDPSGARPAAASPEDAAACSTRPRPPTATGASRAPCCSRSAIIGRIVARMRFCTARNSTRRRSYSDSRRVQKHSAMARSPSTRTPAAAHPNVGTTSSSPPTLPASSGSNPRSRSTRTISDGPVARLSSRPHWPSAGSPHDGHAASSRRRRRPPTEPCAPRHARAGAGPPSWPAGTCRPTDGPRSPLESNGVCPVFVCALASAPRSSSQAAIRPKTRRGNVQSGHPAPRF